MVVDLFFQRISNRVGIDRRFIRLVYNGKGVSGRDDTALQKVLSELFQDEEYIHVGINYAKSEWEAMMDATTGDNELLYGYLCDEVVQGFEIVSDQELASGDFMLLASTDEKYAAEEERRQEMQEEIIEAVKQDEDRMKQYNEHQTQLDLFNLPDEYTKEEHSKKRHKCMRGLKVYTAAAKNSNTISPPSSRSTTKEARNNKDKGWSDKANKFLKEVKARIKADEEAGTHKKWEKMYREITKAVKKARDSSEESGGEDTAFQVDCNEMYEL